MTLFASTAGPTGLIKYVLGLLQLPANVEGSIIDRPGEFAFDVSSVSSKRVCIARPSRFRRPFSDILASMTISRRPSGPQEPRKYDS